VGAQPVRQQGENTARRPSESRSARTGRARFESFLLEKDHIRADEGDQQQMRKQVAMNRKPKQVIQRLGKADE